MWLFIFLTVIKNKWDFINKLATVSWTDFLRVHCPRSDNRGLSFVSWGCGIYGNPVDAFYRQWHDCTTSIKSLLCQPFLRALNSRGMHPIIGTLSALPQGDNDAPILLSDLNRSQKISFIYCVPRCRLKSEGERFHHGEEEMR